MHGVPDDFEEDLRRFRIVKPHRFSSFGIIHGSVLERVWQILAEAGIRSRIDLMENPYVPLPLWFWSVTVLQMEGEEDVRGRIDSIKYVVWGAIAVIYCDYGLAYEVCVRFFTTRNEGRSYWCLS